MGRLQAHIEPDYHFYLKFFMWKPYAEFADELGVSVPAAISHYHHAKDPMTEALKFADNRVADLGQVKTGNGVQRESLREFSKIYEMIF